MKSNLLISLPSLVMHYYPETVASGISDEEKNDFQTTFVS